MRSQCWETRSCSSKVVAITGAAGGIGRELCSYFGGEGAAIVALDRSPAVMDCAGEQRSAGVTVEAAIVDIGDASAVAEAFASVENAIGTTDILINNASATLAPSLEKTTPESFAANVKANVTGAYNCCHAVLPAMKAKKAGAIVNIGSVNGLMAFGDPPTAPARRE